MLTHRQDRHDATAFELLPAIDLRGGRVVRLVEGDFARETVYGDDPARVAARFRDAGARWIHVVDLDGARDGTWRQTALMERIVETAGPGVACELAGGLRDEAAVATALATGARRVVVGTAALRDPEFAARLIERHGADRIAIALDVRDGLAVGHGWVQGAAGLPVEAALAALAERGAATFIVTAIERDGLLSGPDLALLARLVGANLGRIVASAGVSSLDDLEAVRRIGCSGAVVGKAIYEGRLDLAAAVRLLDSPAPDPKRSA
jgi:phosphoribosylformimino-5-aminoimidazole carboxamide ribotide isomerase